MRVKVEKNGDEQQYKLCSSSKLGIEIPVSLPARFSSEFTDGTEVKCQVLKHVSMTYNTAKILSELNDRAQEDRVSDKSTLTKAYFVYELELMFGIGVFEKANESESFCPVCGRRGKEEEKEEVDAYPFPKNYHKKPVTEIEHNGCECNSKVVSGIIESYRSFYDKLGDLLGYHLGDDEKRPNRAFLCHLKRNYKDLFEDSVVVKPKGDKAKWICVYIPLPFKKSIITEVVPRFIASKNTSKVWNGRRWEERVGEEDDRSTFPTKVCPGIDIKWLQAAKEFFVPNDTAEHFGFPPFATIKPKNIVEAEKERYYKPKPREKYTYKLNKEKKNARKEGDLIGKGKFQGIKIKDYGYLKVSDKPINAIVNSSSTTTRKAFNVMLWINDKDERDTDNKPSWNNIINLLSCNDARVLQAYDEIPKYNRDVSGLRYGRTAYGRGLTPHPRYYSKTRVQTRQLLDCRRSWYNKHEYEVSGRYYWMLDDIFSEYMSHCVSPDWTRSKATEKIENKQHICTTVSHQKKSDWVTRKGPEYDPGSEDRFKASIHEGMKLENLATNLDKKAGRYVLKIPGLLYCSKVYGLVIRHERELVTRDVQLSPGLWFYPRKSDFVDTAHKFRNLHEFDHRATTIITPHGLSTTIIKHNGMAFTEVSPGQAIIAPYMVENLSKLPPAKGFYGNALRKGYTNDDGKFHEISRLFVHRYMPNGPMLGNTFVIMTKTRLRGFSPLGSIGVIKGWLDSRYYEPSVKLTKDQRKSTKR
ncbi:MAG: hypothetical protein ABR985_16860, partial [Methanotrichaceae archaeon]